MSVETCTDFLRVAQDSPELRQQMKAVTGAREMVLLGRRHGHEFDVGDLVEASSAFRSTPPAPTRTPARDGDRAPAARPGGGASGPGPEPAPDTAFHHHEYRLADLPALRPIVEALPRLKVRPPSVDLGRFQREFCADDLASTSMSPADPGFQRWHRTMMSTGWRAPGADREAPRRDFHLVNLDEHVDHDGYDGYFAAKNQVIAALEEFFGAEVRSSGCLWYPPGAYRLWHTNETQPGWRMYVIDFDQRFDEPADGSFFRYLNPRTHEIVTLNERPQIVRFFKAEQHPDRLFWHCIVNSTSLHRWSFGFVVPDNWIDAFARTGA